MWYYDEIDSEEKDSDGGDDADDDDDDDNDDDDRNGGDADDDDDDDDVMLINMFTIGVTLHHQNSRSSSIFWYQSFSLLHILSMSLSSLRQVSEGFLKLTQGLHVALGLTDQNASR